MKRYGNRELSWLKFNQRVLQEAADERLSLADRLKFISIFSSNLDEFIMVRVGSLTDLVDAGSESKDLTGRTAHQQLSEIYSQTKKLVKRQYALFDNILRQAAEEGLRIERYSDLKKSEKDKLYLRFMSDIYPVLTPLAIDNHRPFPLINNQTIYLAISIRRGQDKLISLLQIPAILPRLIPVEVSAKVARYIYLEELIEQHLEVIFPNMPIESVSRFRITRNADMELNEEGAEDLLRLIETSLQQRRWGQVVRLELVEGYDEKVMKKLIKKLQVKPEQVEQMTDPLDLTFTIGIKGPEGHKQFQFAKHEPKKLKVLERRSLWQQIKNKDLFFHVPYDSFDHFEELIEQAAQDPEVLAIKMTLYRVNTDSRIIKSLKQAAQSGKQVTVLVELLARFDEESNIHWARELEKVGANVMYGVPFLKTHSKIFLIVRRERNQIRRYVHLGTGNYNSKTARIYTDMSVLTAREDFGSDASTFFNFISGYADNPTMNRLIYAPDRLRDRIGLMIDREIEAVAQGKDGAIDIKVNSLIDKKMIDQLYRASRAGVRIRLIVRGICGLIPGVKNQSETIEVHSIVGEFLEHERIYMFANSEPDRTFLSSADLMSRNLDRRIELMFPVVDPDNEERIRLTFELLWRDDTKTRIMNKAGEYELLDGATLHAHEILKHLQYQDVVDFNRQIKELLDGISS